MRVRVEEKRTLRRLFLDFRNSPFVGRARGKNLREICVCGCLDLLDAYESVMRVQRCEVGASMLRRGRDREVVTFLNKTAGRRLDTPTR